MDRLAVKESARRRLTDSVETALSLSGGVVIVDFIDLAESDPQRQRMFSEHLACLQDDLSFDALEPRSFSFNSAWGACPDCTGLGTRLEADPELVVSDPDLTLAEGAIAVWSGDHYFVRLIEALGRLLGFSIDTPWSKLPGRPGMLCCTGMTSTCMSSTPPGTAGSAPTTPPSKARSPTSSASTPKPRMPRVRASSPGSCGKCHARPATGRG